ncbi:MAG: MoxR family ATPase [Nitrospirae bacterium]|nr:MoxR family ATPase [Nitrospirota bacterium]
MPAEGSVRPEASSPSAADSEELVGRLRQKKDRILAEVEKVILGQREVMDLLLTAVFSRGHSLFVGVPGLAKTLMVNTLAQVMDLRFQRIQFTPDLMPSDITGTEVLEEDVTVGKRVFRFIRGPIFTNILLADEINRTPPKTQAALLQAMQEFKVTAGGETYPIEQPFLVFATQNPIEQEGTYPLPEAQLDRFMLHIDVLYPSTETEMEIVKATTGQSAPELQKVISLPEVLDLQNLVRRVPVPDHTVEYAVRLVAHTRPDGKINRGNGKHEMRSLSYVNEWVSWGASPRASQYLIVGAKARALLDGRPYAAIEDVRALAMPVLKHRIILNFKAEAEGVRSETLIQRILDEVKS